MDLKLTDLMDIRKLSDIQDAFTRATGVASIITDMDGIALTKPSGFCALCRNIIRKTEKGLERCEKSDAEFGISSERVVVKRCSSAGLLDAGIRIDVMGEPVGIWMIGQVLPEYDDIESLVGYADYIGADRDTYRKALDKVPRMTMEKFEDICDFLDITARLLMEQLENNLRLKDELKARKEMEERLVESESHYRRLFNSMMNAYAVHEMVYDEEGNPVDYRFIEVNPSFEKMTGLKKEEIVGRNVLEVLPATEDYWIARYAEVVESGRDETFSDFSQEFNKYFMVHAFKVGERSFATIFSDITDYRREQDRLHRSHRLETVGTLAGGLAHEINNPLNGIMNYAQLILDMNLDNDEANGYLLGILDGTKRISDIVKNLLRFARSEFSEHNVCRPDRAIEGTIDMIRSIFKSDQIDIITEIDGELPEMRCNESQFQQVLMNLLTNARDSLNEKYPGYDENKVVIIKCGIVDDGEGEKVRLVVEDHGTGIPDDIMGRIFEPFFTTKGRDSSTGLGLSISHGIISEHGGRITVESKEGEFARFTVTVPVR